MKLLILMIALVITILCAKSSKCIEIEQNSISIENLSETNPTHSSRIQRRSLLRLFGLKRKYRPIQVSVNWRQPTQQRYIPNNNNYNNNHFNHAPIPNGLFVQKNIFFYNGLNSVNQRPNVIPSTPSYDSTTKYKPTTTIENTYSEDPITSIEISTQSTTTTTSNLQFLQNDLSTKTTKSYEIMTTTTSKPQTNKPIILIPSTEPTVTRIPNNLSTEITRSGFTSTSMPQGDAYSELIYDIDPRYRK